MKGEKRRGLFARLGRALTGRGAERSADTPEPPAAGPNASAELPARQSEAPTSVPSEQPSAATSTEHSNTTPADRDRAVRVFVSSTFRDMVEDRNALMA